MKTIIINITEGGEIICNDTNLGKAGEHNNTKIHIIMTDNSLLECDYFRYWFGNKYSTDLLADGGQIMFKIPQDALIPPTVDFQLCGYKAENGVPYVVARSAILKFSVDESACCSLISDQAFEPFEVILHDCENATKAARASEMEAENSANQTRVYYEETIEAIRNLPDYETLLSSKADKVTGSKDQYIGFEEDGTTVQAITPDTTPNKNSQKLITSGGVYDAIEKADKESNNTYLSRTDFLIQREFIYAEIGKKADKSYIDEQIGDIETVLDGIIALQNSLIGGVGE